ncbi:MAG: 16S rRNA (guanine(966)-N(2))-methyltransferase RsmD [Treponema sp.]|nr:16S rRNA (guanine(966)-N(2))-methyltransferase RsmD [Treponema sp.]
MRIIGGVLKGQILKCPVGVIRPAMDKMKESIFQIIGELSQKSFLDLFSGSASIALEASSRGAQTIYLVEKDKLKVNTILENIKISPVKIHCKFMSAELFLKRNKEQFDYIFCDPPFPYNFHKELIDLIYSTGSLKKTGIVMIHRPSEKILPEIINGFKRVDQRIFGRSVVDFYQYNV